jgi:replicative DNA helicase
MIPQNVEAEQSVVGGILLGAKPPAIASSDFYRPAHGLIFEAVLSLERRQEPVDTLTVKAELERMGRLQEAGGAFYLAALVDSVPSIENIAHYAEIVKDRATLRRILTACRTLADAALDPGRKADDVVDEFQAAALKMTPSESRGHSLKDLVKQQLRGVESAYQEKKDLIGINTGYRDLNRLTLGWQSSDLVVIAGRPGMGKTGFALGTAKAAVRAGVKVHFCSLEMSAAQLTMRLLSGESGINGRALRLGRFPEGDWTRIISAAGEIADLDMTIDDTASITELELARQVRRVKPGLLVVDYLQLMRSAQRAERKDLEIANITGALKALAKEMCLPVILLSQLNREADKRNNPRPRLADLRDSGAIEQDADVVLGLYRGDGANTAEVICLKHRNGPVGTVKLAFREGLASFADLVCE